MQILTLNLSLLLWFVSVILSKQEMNTSTGNTVFPVNNHQSAAVSQSTQIPLINKLPDNKLSGCVINDGQIAASESGAVHDLDLIWIHLEPVSSLRRMTSETP